MVLLKKKYIYIYIPNGWRKECLNIGTLAVETKPLHGIKRFPQCNHIFLERSEIRRESRQKRTDKKVASKGHRRDRQKNRNRVGEGKKCLKA